MARCTARSIVCLVLASIGAACGGSKSPSGPPPVTGLAITLSQTSATQSSQVSFTITLPTSGVPVDAVFLLEISFNDFKPSVDSTTVPAGATGFTGTLSIPARLPDGTIHLTAVLPEQRDSATADLTVKDSLPPSLTFGFVAATSPRITWEPVTTPYLTTTTSNDTLALSALDEHQVAWIGYAIGAPVNIRDSIAFGDSSAVWRAPLSLPSSAAGTAPTFSVFAVNADGYRTEYDEGALMVGGYVDRPVASAAVDTSVRQLAYDAKRNLIYLAQPSTSSIRVMSLSSMTNLASIAVPAQPRGLDITPSGDTLVVALANTADLAFVDLNGDALLGVTHLNSLNTTAGDSTHLAYVVDDVRVAGDGLILVPISQNPLGGAAGALAQLNRTSASDSIVSMGANWFVSAAKSVDGSKVLLTNTMIPAAGTTSYAAIYDAVAHAYVPIPHSAGEQELETWAAADQSGSHYLVAESVYDGAMHYQGNVGPYVYSYADIWGSTIAPSGSVVFVSRGPNILRFDITKPAVGEAGQLLDVASAPDNVRAMWATPDGHWLIVLGLSTIMRVDLTQSSPHVQRIRLARRQPSSGPTRASAHPMATLRPTGARHPVE